MNNPQKIAIIISNNNGLSVNYKNKSILKSILKDVMQTDYPSFKVIIDDSSNTEKDILYVKKHYPEIDIYHNRGTLSENWNIIIKEILKKDYDGIALLNNDLILKDKSWLKKLLNTNKKGVWGIIGCKLLYPNKTIQHAGLNLNSIMPYNIGHAEKDNGQFDLKFNNSNGVTFACVLMDIPLIRDVGKFDEAFMMGFEDADYCMRALDKGYPIAFCKNSNIVHLESFTIAKNKKNILFNREKFYYSQRNAFYYILKHYSFFKRIIAILWVFSGSIIKIENKDSKRFSSIQFERPYIERLKISFNAYINAKGTSSGEYSWTSEE